MYILTAMVLAGLLYCHAIQACTAHPMLLLLPLVSLPLLLPIVHRSTAADSLIPCTLPLPPSILLSTKLWFALALCWRFAQIDMYRVDGPAQDLLRMASQFTQIRGVAVAAAGSPLLSRVEIVEICLVVHHLVQTWMIGAQRAPPNSPHLQLARA